MSLQLDLDSTVFLFIDFQVDVCGEGGRMLPQQPDVLAKYAATRKAASNLLEQVRKRDGAHYAFIRHGFGDDYPELPEPNLSGMERYIKGQGAFQRSHAESEFVPEFTPEPGELVFHKSTLSAFVGTGLPRWFNKIGAKTVVIAGVVTHYGVMSAVISAFDLGYRVVVVRDGCTSTDPALHDAALRIMEPIADIRDSAEVIGAL